MELKVISKTAAIDKIITALAYKDYRAYNPLGKDGRPKYKKHRPYTLSAETNEAREVKQDYLSGKISTAEYKAWCLRWNLTHRKES